MAFGVRHFVAAAAVAAALAYTSLYGQLYPYPQIHSDGYSYYVYLPSVFIYHDVTLEKLANEWYGGPYPDFTGIRRWPSTNRWLNLHPIGTAILMAPFFVAADWLSAWTNLPRDGFSLYYQHGAALAAVAYFLLGLAILRRMLRQQFSDGVVLATLICITWGTNLFHYAVFDGTFSHAFAFFLVCVWLWLVEQWWERPTLACSLAIGGVAALNVLVRHTNAIFILLLPLYGLVRWQDVRGRVLELRSRWRMLAVAALAGTLVLAPQLALFKWITGQWFVNAYVTHGMGFTFGSPHLVAVLLFSTQRDCSSGRRSCFPERGGCFRRDRPGQVVGVRGGRAVRAPDPADCELGGMAVRRELRASRLSPTASPSPRRSSHRPLRGRRATGERCRFVAVGGRPPSRCRSRRYQYWIGVLPMANTTGAIPICFSIPMTRASWIKAAAGLLIVAGVLGYLYDPPWMGGVTSGLRPWEQDPPGTLFRWTAGRATFFVPSNVATMTVPLRAVFPGPNGAPVMVELRDDDRLLMTIELSDPNAWVRTTVPLKRHTDNRRFRRHRPARLARPSSIRARRDDW
jgi:hypothetical protein